MTTTTFRPEAFAPALPSTELRRGHTLGLGAMALALCAGVCLGAPGISLAGPTTLIVGVQAGLVTSDSGELPTPPPDLDLAVADLGGSVSRCFEGASLCMVDLSPDSSDADMILAQDELASVPSVRYVELDRALQGAPRVLVEKSDEAGTSQCPDQWELDAIEVREAWRTATGSWAPLIAIEDSGFLDSHEEIVGRIAHQYDFGNGDDLAEVEWGSGIPDHGTFIGALLVGNPDNGKGRAGVAPGARVVLQKIADDQGSLFFSYAVEAMAALAENPGGVRILNYSIATASDTAAFRDAVEALGDVGILVVTAAGNCTVANCAEANNDAQPMYPGSYPFEHVLTVAGSTRDGSLNPFSHYGASSVDIAAPGVDLCSAGASADDEYYTASGTSYAAPLVAGVAALVLEAHPILSPREVIGVLESSAVPKRGLSGVVATGALVNARRALDAPVPRFARILDTEIAGETNIDLLVENVGSAGQACLVVTHGAGIEIAAVRDTMTGGCWDLDVAAPGGTPVTLPDAGSTVAGDVSIAVACGPIDRHTSPIVRVVTRGRSAGSTPVTVRSVMTNESVTFLGAPSGEGVTDATGFDAWPAQWRVTATTDADDDPCSASPSDDVGPSPDAGPSTEDAGSSSADAGSTDASLEDEDDKTDSPPKPGRSQVASDEGSGCGCQTRPTPTTPGVWALLVVTLAALLLRGRRYSA